MQKQTETLKIILDQLQRLPSMANRAQLIVDVYNELKNDPTYICKLPDVIVINSLKQVVGENMIYIDDFIFVNVPD